jgi:hypothetical protein
MKTTQTMGRSSLSREQAKDTTLYVAIKITTGRIPFGPVGEFHSNRSWKNAGRRQFGEVACFQRDDQVRQTRQACDGHAATRR